KYISHVVPACGPDLVGHCCPAYVLLFFFFFNDTATTEIYTLSLHDALPIYGLVYGATVIPHDGAMTIWQKPDRKSTRLNSSHMSISYAVFCLKKKTHTCPPDDFLITPTRFLTPQSLHPIK